MALMVMLLILMMVMAAMALMVMLLILMMVMAAMAVVIVFLLGKPLHFQPCQLSRQGHFPIHRLQELGAGELLPGGCDDGSYFIVLPEQLHSRIQLGLRNGIGTGQNDGRCRFDLVIVEFSEILHIYLDFARICHSHGISQCHIFPGDLIDSANHVRELANTGGFNEDPIRRVLLDHLGQRLAEITHQGAANAAGVHLGNVDPGILQKAAVNADLPELVFDQNQFLALIGLTDHFLDERGFSRP